MTTFNHHSTVLLRTLLISLIAVVTLVQPATVWAATSASPKAVSTDQSTVVVKLKSSAGIGLGTHGFQHNSGQGDAQLNAFLSGQTVTSKSKMLVESSETIKQRRSTFSTPLPQGVGDLENYYILKLAPGKKADDVAAKLKTLSTVETAYAKPLPVRPPLAPDYSPRQDHLKAAPRGLGVYATIGGAINGSRYPGSAGTTVKVVDIEFSWNTQHEDLSSLRKPDAIWKNGTPQDPFNDKNHGTAVAGIIAGDRNAGGIYGITPNVSFHVMNAYNKERYFDTVNAVYLAANKMSAGDIMLIEVQNPAPDYEGYGPVEMEPAVYDAIRYATAKGITVIEPAGNGHSQYEEGYNLNTTLFGNAFTTKADSGAIMVGAGSSDCNFITPARARLAYSNYGSRVDVQAYGDCVVTTGYGDLSPVSAKTNALYTEQFMGTSSASAIIAGAAAELSSTYKYINKKALTPATIRATLKKGGSPQDTTNNPGNIGPMPNMAAALQTTDITKPTAPTTLAGKLTTANKIALSWKPSTDNLSYVTYTVYRNGLSLGQVNGTSYIDTSVKAKTKYIYKVVAIDGSKNTSIFSNSIAVTTK